MDTVINALTESGINKQMLILILYVPVVATVVNIARYFVGVKMYGIYAPMILAFAYIFTGIRFGLLITAATITATLLTYTLMRKIRMHYLARIAINYTIISFVILGFIFVNSISPIKITSENHIITEATPLGIILIATLSDFFIKQYVKKSFIVTMRSLIETVVVAVIGWALLTQRDGEFGEFLLYQIWIYPLLIAINILLGQYTGLRLKDFSRFKRVWQN